MGRTISSLVGLLTAMLNLEVQFERASVCPLTYGYGSVWHDSPARCKDAIITHGQSPQISYYILDINLKI